MRIVSLSLCVTISLVLRQSDFRSVVRQSRSAGCTIYGPTQTLDGVRSIHEGTDLIAGCDCRRHLYDRAVWRLNGHDVDPRREGIEIADTQPESSVLTIKQISKQQEGALCCMRNTSLVCFRFRVIDPPSVIMTQLSWNGYNTMNITCVVKSLLESDIDEGFMRLLVNNSGTLLFDRYPVKGTETHQTGKILWKVTHQYQFNLQKSVQDSNFSCLWTQGDGETYESKTAFPFPTYSTSVTSRPETRSNSAVIAALVPSLVFVLILFIAIWCWKTNRMPRILCQEQETSAPKDAASDTGETQGSTSGSSPEELDSADKKTDRDRDGTDTGSPSHETTQEKVLRPFWTILIDNLDPELIIDDLYRAKVIDKRVLERIRYGHGNFRQDKAKDLLSVMQQSSVEAVKRFAEILSQASLLKDLGEQLLQAIEIENTSMLRIEQEEESRSPVSPLGTDHATETRNARTVECENDCPETGGDNPPLTTTTACAAKLKSFTEVPGVDARALSTNVEEQNSRFASESDPIGKLTITVGPEGRSVRNGSMSLDIPRGAVEEFVILSSHLYIDKCKLPPVDTAKDEYLFSPVLTLYPQGYQFKKPVSVKFPFNAVASDWLLVLLRENCQTSNTDSTWKEVVVYDTDTGTVNTTDCSYDVFEASLTISRFYDHCWLGKPLKDCLLKCRKLIYCSAFGFQKPHENLNIWVLEVIMHDQCDDLFNNIESKQRQKIPRRLWFDGPAVLQIGLHDVVTCTLKAASWQTDEPEKTLSAAHFWSALFGNENRFLYELILRSDFGKDDDAGMVVNVSTSSDTTPIHLNIDPPLGEPQISSSTGPSILLGDHEFGISTANYVKAKQRTSVARKIASHWEELAALLAPHFFTVHKLAEIKRQYTCSLVSQANAMLDMWSDLFDKQATCRVLIRALLDIGWKEVAVEVFSPLLVELVELHCRETYT